MTNEQAQLWNTTSGCAWVDLQPLLDQVLDPLQDPLLDAVRAGTPRRVLDVGCGTGTTTLAAARLLGTRGACVGIDISEPMLAHARTRAEQANVTASFICDDAQTHAFEPASFDMIISRLGVMFFEDFVKAFSNLRRAAKADAELCFIAWRSPTENPFMTTAESAAAPLLPDLPSRKPDAPGQFAFADREQVSRILASSGWSSIDIQPIDVLCRFPEPGLIPYFSRLGPVGQMLHQVDPPTRTRVIETVRAAFDPFVHGSEVRFDAACWVARARAA
ncbi:MAG: class I SAM-dependent methyltransferase [Steroidobacter sp.]